MTAIPLLIFFGQYEFSWGYDSPVSLLEIRA
jgi:hypothetical protein